jgi:hypothetical protein
MKTHLYVCSLLLSLLHGGAFASDQPTPGQTKPSAHKLTGPYTHENLTIFLIHGEDLLKNKHFLTLQEGLQQKKVIVHETQNVNELAIENVSTDGDVFVMAGDIVKGGQQDRVIAVDIIIAAKSGRVPIAAFCVEAGRWTRRGQEDVRRFESSSSNAPTKDLKIAVRQQMDQGKVWENVSKVQMQLAGNVGGSVRSVRSASSLQLSLEDKKLQDKMQTYLKKLLPAVDGKNDVLGYVCALNGELNSADAFASHELFLKAWPVLLKGSVVEAIAELKKDQKVAPVTLQAAERFLADAQKGKTTEKQLSNQVRIIQKESKELLLFETQAPAALQAAPLRSSYLKK